MQELQRLVDIKGEEEYHAIASLKEHKTFESFARKRVREIIPPKLASLRRFMTLQMKLLIMPPASAQVPSLH